MHTEPNSASAPGAEGFLEVRGLTKTFVRSRDLIGRPRERVHALDHVDLSVKEGETLGIVGESGSGKSTLGRVILGLQKADDGDVLFRGENLGTLSARAMARRRRDLQMVFQDPYSSLDPTKTVETSIAEPLLVHDGQRLSQSRERVRELLGLVGLRADYAERYPAEMSGGQRQRVAIARALALNPKVIVADEAVSALDVSTQSEVLNLMMRLQAELGLTYLFVSHNLAVVRHISTRIAVMYLGRIVEIGPAEEVYAEPRHPYTKALLSAIPIPDPVIQKTRERIVLLGDAPDPAHPPVGCNFATRCPEAVEECHRVDPALLPVDDGRRLAACLLLEPTAAG